MGYHACMRMQCTKTCFQWQKWFEECNYQLICILLLPDGCHVEWLLLRLCKAACGWILRHCQLTTGRFPLSVKAKSKRILVTGGAGFVGSHLVDRLIERGDSVIVVDNFFMGRKENLLHHFGNPKFELIRHDVVEPILLEVDQIYHLACPASPVHYKFNPVKTIKTNVVETLNMLGLAKRVGARFLLTSTSEVYGDPLQHPQAETYWGNVNPIGVRSCYDEGKRTAETLIMDYHRGAGIELEATTWFRNLLAQPLSENNLKLHQGDRRHAADTQSMWSAMHMQSDARLWSEMVLPAAETRRIWHLSHHGHIYK